MKWSLTFYLSLMSSLTVTAQTSLKELSIGDRMPDLEFTNVINSRDSKIKISDFRGKVLIVDFWATWCSPCIAQFKKLEALQKKLGLGFQLLSVTSENAERASQIYNQIKERQGLKLPPSVVEDSVLFKIFPHKLIPHYVWIDKQGVIRAITGAESVSEENLNKLINANAINLPIKRDELSQVNYDIPPFFSGQIPLTSDEVLYRSVFARYIQGRGTQTSWRKRHLTCINHPIKLLYKIAFGGLSDWKYLNDNMMMLENFDKADSIRIGFYTESTKGKWQEIKKEHMYNYEIVFPDSVSKDTKIKAMQQDLNRYFAADGIHGRLDTRKIKILALVRTSELDRIKTKGGNSQEVKNDFYYSMKNMPLHAFLEKLQAWYTKAGALPMEDHTRYANYVDLVIEADLTDIPSINKQLEKYDLKFVEKEVVREMIIISKNKLTNTAILR